MAWYTFDPRVIANVTRRTPKAPTQIEAVEIQPENYAALQALAERDPGCHLFPAYGDDGRFDLPVQAGGAVLRGERGDWLVRFRDGDVRLVRRDTFAANMMPDAAMTGPGGGQ